MDTEQETVRDRYQRFHERDIEPMLARRRELGDGWADMPMGSVARDILYTAGKRQRRRERHENHH